MSIANEFWTAAFHNSTTPSALYKSAASSDSPDFVAHAGLNFSVRSKVKQGGHAIFSPPAQRVELLNFEDHRSA